MNRRTFFAALLAIPTALKAPRAPAATKPWTMYLVAEPIRFQAERNVSMKRSETSTELRLPDGRVVMLRDWIHEPLY